MSIIDQFLQLLGALAVALFVFSSTQRWVQNGPERNVLAISFAAQMLAAFAQVWITMYIYGSGDMLTYHFHGVELARLMHFDFQRFAPEVFKLIFAQKNVVLPYHIPGIGSSTGSMAGIAGALNYVLGNALYASCVLIGTFSWLGKLSLYRALRARMPPHYHLRAMVGVMLVPSALFWTGGLVKESIAMIGLGPLVLGLWSFRRDYIAKPLALLMFGGLAVGLSKGYVLFGFAIAAGAWFYWEKALERSGGREVTIRPFYMVLALSAGLGAVVVLGWLFPAYGVEQVIQQTESLQQIGARVQGGSNYEIVDVPRRGLAGQLGYAPVALLTALFRPSLPEVRNGLMAINALETTILLVLFIRAVMQQSWGVLFRRLRGSSALVFCFVFTLVFGIAVGLATTNLGTLSRYRAPLMPFFVTLVLLWTAPDPVSARAPAAVPAVRGRAAPRRRGPTIESAP